MRFAIAGLMLALALPAAAKSPKSQCKDRCSTMYDFCQKHAITKQARKACKSEKKGCKGQCVSK